MTLLEIVQQVLNEVDGDEVNSISDTAEAEQVASHVKNVYNNIVSNSTWAHTRTAVPLVPRSDNTKPTHVDLADNVKELTTVYYNKMKTGDTKRQYDEVKYLDLDKFLVKINTRDNTQDNVDLITDDSGIELLILNDKHPEYYTTVDDTSLVFDSYDSEVDSTLHQSKFQAHGFVVPSFTVSDEFTPQLPPDAFALLIEKSISRCQWKMRQFEDPESITEGQRQARFMSRNHWRTNENRNRRNYGRNGKGRVQGVQPWS